MQKPKPNNAIGVPVTLVAVDSSGGVTEIGTVTSDMYGNFGLAWTPSSKGTYQIIANFAGTNSYGSSSASTYLTVNAAAPAPTTTPTNTPTQTLAPTTTPTITISASPTVAPTPGIGLSTETLLIAGAAVVIIIIVVAAALVLRTAKKDNKKTIIFPLLFLILKKGTNVPLFSAKFTRPRVQ